MDHTKVLLLIDSDDENIIEIHDTLKDNGFNILAVINIKKTMI